MNFDGKEMQEEFNAAFGNLFIDTTGNPESIFSIEKLDTRQLWFLVKFAKHIRQRCRNNAALNNYLNRNFPNATFKEVPKKRLDGSSYMGLSITINGETVEDGDD